MNIILGAFQFGIEFNKTTTSDQGTGLMDRVMKSSMNSALKC